ncbi:MAG: cupin domain-containing protein [Thermomicrobiales bacterium]
MQYTRLYADSTGESHFEDLALDFQLIQYAPPTPDIYVSRFTPATQYGVLILPPGWDGGLHPVPNRQVYFVLNGVVEVELSGGETRRFAPGQMVVGEDTTGKGHHTRVVSEEELVLATVHLPA